MIRRLREDERGSLVATSVLLTAIMLAFGFATLAMVDTQQLQARDERVGETTFNLAEAALTTQAFSVIRAWPGKAEPGAAQPVFPTCPVAVGADARCPDEGRLTAELGDELPEGAVVRTEVRDNAEDSDGAGLADQDLFYDPARTPAHPAYDANDDSRMWVRSATVVDGREHSIVALVRVVEQFVPFPRSVIIAGHLETQNNGKKTIIDTDGDLLLNPTGQAAPASVRCGRATQGCMMADLTKGQISPPSVLYDHPPADVLDDATARLLEDAARAAGTRHDGCPSSLAGAVVYVADAGTCSFTGNTVFNTADRPGILVVARGTLVLGGNVSYHGIVYARNDQATNASVVSIQGTALVHGAVFVDGAGGVHAGASKENVVYNPRAFETGAVISDGAIVRNTWRELPGRTVREEAQP